MRQGRRLIRRKALKVVVSRELPRSGEPAGGRVQDVDGALIIGQGPVGGSLDRAGEAGLSALVAQVPEDSAGRRWSTPSVAVAPPCALTRR